MKNILWLVSWYPNRFGKYDGDFVQRQARAASLYANIHLLYLHRVTTEMPGEVEEVLTTGTNLTEQIIYYRAPKNIIGKLTSLNIFYKLGKKYIRQYISKNGLPDYVHVQVPLRAGLLAQWVKKTYKVPYALTEHYGIYNDVQDDNFNNRSIFFRGAVRKIIRQAQPLICVSRQLGQDINTMAIKKDFIYIPNVVNTSFFKFEEGREKNKPFRFLHISNMLPYKNVEGIIDGAKLLSATRNDFELHIIGKYPAHIFKHAVQSGVLNKHVFFTGEIPYTQVAIEMERAGALILFSNGESASCVVEEALCVGLPVISTPVGVALEYINAQNGLITEIKNIRQLSEKMSTMINTASAYNHAGISAAYTKLFSYREIGKKIVDCYGD